ncbi:hypothetical protein ACH427_18525 [Streptomyces sp. NPDC020379]|uniref:hypothetical protein n=1 Tax=Streptomyces sp. NPDC020379 TaxID=3365071 RepID=UPI0037A593DC
MPAGHRVEDAGSLLPRPSSADLAGTLVQDFDVMGLLHRSLAEHCVNLLGVAAAGVLLATPGGQLVRAAAPDERIRRLELAGASTGGALQQRAVRRQMTVPARPRFALDSRVIIERAKGGLASRRGTGTEDTLALRRHRGCAPCLAGHGGCLTPAAAPSVRRHPALGRRPACLAP